MTALWHTPPPLFYQLTCGQQQTHSHDFPSEGWPASGIRPTQKATGQKTKDIQDYTELVSSNINNILFTNK